MIGNPIRYEIEVSIHAPVKGATQGRISLPKLFWSFNSRTRKGCDDKYAKALVALKVSIHAPVKGATRF